MDKGVQFEDFDFAGKQKMVTFQGKPTPFQLSEHSDPSEGGFTAIAKHENGWESSIDVDRNEEGKTEATISSHARGAQNPETGIRRRIADAVDPGTERYEGKEYKPRVFDFSSHEHILDHLKKVSKLPSIDHDDSEGWVTRHAPNGSGVSWEHRQYPIGQ